MELENENKFGIVGEYYLKHGGLNGFSVLGSRFSVLGSRFLRFLSPLKHKSNRFFFASLAIVCLSTCGGGGGGGGSNGENGSGGPQAPPLPRQIIAGNKHTCVLLVDRSAKCWGEGADGRLGQGNTNDIGDDSNDNIATLPIIPLGAGRTALLIAGGALSEHTCAILDDDTLKCWGNNGQGRLGQEIGQDIGDAPGEMAALAPVNLGTGRTARLIAPADGHTCAGLDDGSVKCWGWYDNDQLRSGASLPVGDDPGEMGDSLPTIALGANRTARQLVSGDDHSCALLDDSSVKCWGANYGGQLGVGSTALDSLGFSSLSAINLGTNRTARRIASGANHVCALLDDDSLKCWGENRSGQLGQGHTNDLGDGPNEMGNNLTAVNLGAGRTASQLALGQDHTCALLDDGSVKCWGENGSGQLGQGNTDDIGDDAGEMANLQPIDLGTGRRAVYIAAGANHTCALLDNSSLKCWGANGSGQLGLGHTNNLGDGNRSDGTSEMGDNLPAVSFR